MATGRGGDVSNVTSTRTPRQETELRLMQHLNRQKAYRVHFFDCGTVGKVMMIWSSSGWDAQWFEFEPLPAALKEET
jgi:hypothetical protein